MTLSMSLVEVHRLTSLNGTISLWYVGRKTYPDPDYCNYHLTCDSVAKRFVHVFLYLCSDTFCTCRCFVDLVHNSRMRQTRLQSYCGNNILFPVCVYYVAGLCGAFKEEVNVRYDILNVLVHMKKHNRLLN